MSAALNLGTVTRALPPLVVALKGGSYAWIQHGHGFLLHACSGAWVPLVDAEGIGGHVLKAAQVAALVATYGRPA